MWREVAPVLEQFWAGGAIKVRDGVVMEGADKLSMPRKTSMDQAGMALVLKWNQKQYGFVYWEGEHKESGNTVKVKNAQDRKVIVVIEENGQRCVCATPDNWGEGEVGFDACVAYMTGLAERYISGTPMVNIKTEKRKKVSALKKKAAMDERRRIQSEARLNQAKKDEDKVKIEAAEKEKVKIEAAEKGKVAAKKRPTAQASRGAKKAKAAQETVANAKADADANKVKTEAEADANKVKIEAGADANKVKIEEGAEAKARAKNVNIEKGPKRSMQGTIEQIDAACAKLIGSNPPSVNPSQCMSSEHEDQPWASAQESDDGVDGEPVSDTSPPRTPERASASQIPQTLFDDLESLG